jgi:hypothetical protein
MLTVKQLFQADGLDVAEDRIKLVRHVDHASCSIRKMIRDDVFDLYQAEQDASISPFHKCDVILSFLGTEGSKAEFHGAYEVLGAREFTKEDLIGLPNWLIKARKVGEPRIIYDLRELPQFQAYRSRLIAAWKAPLKWHRMKDLEIYEILPATTTTLFPGYQEALLSFDALKKIFADDRAHRDWKAALKANAGARKRGQT